MPVPPPKRKIIARTKTSSAPSVPAKPAKTFSVGNGGASRGTKFIIYGESGIGKSSLAALAPTPVIIPLDDGSANLRDPRTGEHIKEVEGVLTFGDTLSALRQVGIYDDFETVIVDTGTKLEDLSHEYMFETIKHEKGHTVKNIEGYGYGKGYRHMYDTMKLILPACDELTRRGKNVIIICQAQAISIANAAGDDYLCNGPRLYPGSKSMPSIRDLYCEWADHVLLVDHANTVVADKKIKGNVTRAVFTQGELHFKAKTRPLANGNTVEPIISFDDPSDDSIFTFIFGGAE